MLVLRSEGEMRAALDEQRTLIALRFPADCSRSVTAGRPIAIQAILDGRRSNSGQIALGYLQRILQGYLEDRNGGQRRVAPSEILVRHWFNPNLDYVRHIVPSLVAIITTI